jgi:hypothetical protein
MSAWWVEFDGFKTGCVETEGNEDVRVVAKEVTKHDVTRADRLPYPANPRYRKINGSGGPCPSFCYTPERCRGRSSCPHDIVCTE